MGNFQIILSPAAAIPSGAAWQVAALSASYYSDSAPHPLMAGDYTVVFHAATGCVTPANATINVIANQTATLNITYEAVEPPTAPGWASAAISGGSLHLTVTGSANEQVVVERSTNLVNWTPVITNTVGAGGSVDFSDSMATNRPHAFYRARAVP